MANSTRKYLDRILSRRGPFTDEEWEPGEGVIDALARSKVLYAH
jgi:NEDD8-activating enzyme E1